MKRVASGIVMILLLSGMLYSALKISPVIALEVIYIRADGSINPPTAPISTGNNVTYTFTDDIVFALLVVERNDIVIDGMGHSILGGSNQVSTLAIDLTGRSNVSIQNTRIKDYGTGIMLNSSYNNRFSRNTMTNNGGAIHAEHSSNNNISENNMISNGVSIWLSSSANNSISGNAIYTEGLATLSGEGIRLDDSSYYNIVSKNNMTGRSNGIALYFSADHNDVTANNLADCGSGIVLSSNYNNVRENTIANSLSGIYFSGSSNSNISGNKITGSNYTGVAIAQDSSGNRVSENTITDNNEHGILIDWRSKYNGIDRNTIANNSLYGIKVHGYADYQNITGNMVIDNGGGIDLCDCSYNTIVGNVIANNSGHGIQIGGSWNGAVAHGFSFNNSISENTIADNMFHGILLGYDYADSATNCSINRNVIENNDCGIWVNSTTHNIIFENSLAYNGYGVWLYSSSNRNVVKGNKFIYGGLTVWDSYQNVVESNTVNGKPLIYLESEANQSVNDAGQVILVNCNGMRVESLNLSGTDIGVQLWGTSSSSIAGNIITNSRYGISLALCYDNSVSGNNIAQNTWHGISLSLCYDNSISGNNIVNNYYGIWLFYSFDNSFYNNNLIGNSQQVNVSSGFANVWDAGYPSGGNFWSDYNGTDLFGGRDQNEAGGDAIGDKEYFIDGNNTDYYPLLGMLSDFNATSDQHVTTICNSTISDFQFNGTAIMFSVAGGEGATGFCRICVPTSLMVADSVFINGSKVSYNLLSCSNSTQSYLYFNYTHPIQEVIIVPEFPSFLILPIVPTATLIVMIICRRKRH